MSENLPLALQQIYQRLHATSSDLISKSKSAFTTAADCADGTVPPVWASTSCGVLLCMRCAGVHRSLGVHVSKVCFCVFSLT